MVSVSILGTGNVATNLFRAFIEIEEVQVVQVIGRNPEALKAFAGQTDTTSDFTKILDVDIIVIAVKDDAISIASDYLKDKKGLVVHTSGSVSIDALSACSRYGVFYPLQTFSMYREVAMKSVPFCLEAHDKADLTMLEVLAGRISDTVYKVDSQQRKALHLAAVFVNNFTNHMYYIGQQVCEERGLPPEILKPLIQETVGKIDDLSPYDAQTGPARRGDFETIEKHLEQLQTTGYAEVYGALSQSIGKLYHDDTRFTER